MAEKSIFSIAKIVSLNRRAFVSLVQHAYFRFYARPLLRLTGNLAANYTVSRGHGAFLLHSEQAFLKLAISPKAKLYLEYENFCRIREARPDLADVLPNYRLVKFLGVCAIVCESLDYIPYVEALKPAVNVYKRLGRYNYKKERFNLKQCTEIVIGLSCIERDFGAKIATNLRDIVEEFCLHGSYTLGLSHGDFHSRNLMRTKTGACFMIDLDCVRLKGIADFDVIYFALEQIWSATGSLWIDSLVECIASRGRNIANILDAFGIEWSRGLIVAFFLDRLGQEYSNYGFKYDRRFLDAVINILDIREV